MSAIFSNYVGANIFLKLFLYYISSTTQTRLYNSSVFYYAIARPTVLTKFELGCLLTSTLSRLNQPQFSWCLVSPFNWIIQQIYV